MPIDSVHDATLDAPALLDGEQLCRSALEPTPRIAVFDCDGTLWSVDAGSGFMRWSIETGLVSRERADWMDARYRSYLRGETGESAICGDMVLLYQGLREEEMRRAARIFAEREVAPRIFPAMQELVTLLREQGAEIWAVSSTCQWVIEEALRPFEIEASRVLAARVRVRAGMLSDVLEAVPTGEDKVAALRKADVEQPDAVFGNSVHDAAMLRFGKRAFAINPSPALQEEAGRRHWPVYLP